MCVFAFQKSGSENTEGVRKMRVLLSAFGFSPYRGSEAAVGWNIARELAKLHDVTVITGAVRYGENDWSRYVAENGTVKGLTVEYVNPSICVRFFDQIHRLPGCWAFYYLAYRLWQKQAYRRAKELTTQKPFDVIHQLNMIGYREPGYLWKLNVPFVWGPIGGGPNEPWAYRCLFSKSGRIKVGLRTILNELQKRCCLRARHAASCAKKLWAVTDADEAMIRWVWGRSCERMVETGAVLRTEGYVRLRNAQAPLCLVWSGIHTSRKALPILLHALARLSGMDIRVDILGEGPETVLWKRLAQTLGVGHLLSWLGRLPHDEALHVMSRAHVLAFPSLKEGTPHVVLEALSLGLPVICHDACGMGTVVTDQCGVKIPLKNPEASIAGFTEALRQLLEHPERVKELSCGALARAKELTWAAKAVEISRGYEEARRG